MGFDGDTNGLTFDRLSESPQLFVTPLLDRLSRSHPASPVIIFTPVILLLLGLTWWQGTGIRALPWLALGYLVWSIGEYVGHRYLFHFEFPGRIGARIHYVMHGVHHDHPSDPGRLVMPPLMSVPIMILASLVAWAVCAPLVWLPVLAGFMIGYVVYDMVHFALHHLKPRTALGRALRRIHMVHHFRDDSVHFGVAAPWWDWVFRTVARPVR